MATGGVIDIDRDGNVSIGDVVNDMNLTTVGGDVVTIATTLATNTAIRTQLDQIASDLNITLADVFTKTPQESKEIEAISNVLYRYVKENNISNLLDINTTQLLDVNTSMILNEYNRYMSDENHDFEKEEKDLVNSIKTDLPTSIDTLDNYAEVESEKTKLDDDLNENEVDELKNHLLTLKNEYELEYGDLDYDDDGEDAYHNQGVSCATCHSTSAATNYGDDSSSNDEVFDSGATIYTSLTAANNDAAKAAYGYSLRLLLNDGTTVSYRIGNGTGNVNATFNAGITSYTAQVINTRGEVVNSSSTNSHDASRFDCNSCHTATGANGAPGRITSFQYTLPIITTPTVDTNATVADTNTTTLPTDTNTTTTPTTASVSFSSNVLPILQTNCQGCHGNYGTYDGVIPFVDTTNAANSALLMKATNTTVHGGGALFNTTSTEYVTIRDWISQGALNN
jgi:mono/diheme cytochrome c family protein